MIITDSFVMLNYPKTGSSFARAVIKELYAKQPKRWFGGKWCKELMLPNIRYSAVATDQHGTYSQIPRRYRNREIVSFVRNPYDRFLSIFGFKYWVNVPLIPWDVVHRNFPTFPDLTLDQFVDFYKLRSELFYEIPVGPQTAQFLQMFDRRFPPLPPGPYDLQNVLGNLANITFLRQENLRQELRSFLHRHGFTETETAFIDTHDRVNATPSYNYPWTQKAIDYITTSEALVFDILEAKGVYYRRQKPLCAAA